MMNKNEFWKIIDSVIALYPGKTQSTARKRGENLVETLQDYSVDDLYAFEKIWDAYKSKLSSKKIVDIADKIAGGLSDDGVTDFLGWAVVQGQTAVESFIEDPVSLYVYVDYKKGSYVDITCETAGYTMMKALEKKAGESYWKNTPENFKDGHYNLKLDRFVKYDEEAEMNYGPHWELVNALIGAIEEHKANKGMLYQPKKSLGKRLAEVVNNYMVAEKK